MKRIAFVFDKMIYGGIERVGLTYIKGLSERGYSIDVYILDVNNVEDIVKELPESVNVRMFKMSRRGVPAFALRLAIKSNAAQYLLPFMKIGLSVIQLFQRVSFGKKVSYDCAIAFSGHMNDLTFVAAHFIDAPKRVAWLHGAQYGYYLMSPSYYELYKRFTNLVCLSDILNNECEKAGYSQAALTSTKIYNPVRLPEYDKDNSSKIARTWGKYILVLGRIAHDKDPLTIIRCAAILRDKYKSETTILFVGDGDLREESEALVSSLGLGNVVQFLGNKSNVGDYYASASCFIHSSPSEGLPTTILEAMSFEIPVVATDSMPGVREIDGGVHCLDICSVGDAEQMAALVQRCLIDEEHANSMINNASKRLESFGYRKAIDGLESIITGDE